MSHHFFIPPEWLTPPTVTLADETARQLRTVLRMRPGDEIIILDNSGRAWRVELTEFSKQTVTGRIISPESLATEPATQLTLFQGTLKAQKFEWVLQKGTELGISQFVPLICQRSIVKETTDLAKKRPRWQRIIQEAAEQSGRAKLPRLAEALPFEVAIDRLAGASVMPWEEAAGQSLKQILSRLTGPQINVLIGPEGGFTVTEADLATDSGVHLVTLGQRILRAETASLVTCAAIFYDWGDWV